MTSSSMLKIGLSQIQIQSCYSLHCSYYLQRKIRRTLPDSLRLCLSLPISWCLSHFFLQHPILQLFQTCFRSPNMQWCVSLESMLDLCLEISLLWSFTSILPIYPSTLSSGIPFKTLCLKVNLDWEILTEVPLISLDSIHD